jgi:predicted ATPase
VAFGLWGFHLVRAEYRIALEMAGRLLELAQSARDPAMLSTAHHTLGTTLKLLGNFRSALEHFAHGITYASRTERSATPFGLYDAWISSRSFRTDTLCLVGFPDQALKSAREAVDRAQKLSNSHDLIIALLFLAAAHYWRGEFSDCQTQTETITRLAGEEGLPDWVAWGALYRGAALGEQGRGDEAIRLIRESLGRMRAMGNELLRSFWLVLMAKEYARVGSPGEGLLLLDEASDTVNRTEERYCEAELYRLKGELLLQRALADSAVEAAACFHQAIDVARGQGAKSLELRAVMSLARLWQMQGKNEEGRKMLADIYGWFTEGFDTADLKDARVLLDQLKD